MDIINLEKLPLKINHNDFRLICSSLFADKNTLIDKIYNFRNLFKDNFNDNSVTSREGTINYVLTINNNQSDRKMYVILINNEIIGHYCLKHCDNNRVLLDNAVRFSSSGPRNIFSTISQVLVNELLKNFTTPVIFTAIKNENIAAKKIHNYGVFIKNKEKFSDLKYAQDIECSYLDINTFKYAKV
jgi:2-polyprenyl-3-methyl-5-hydroxy-6-metoxy-1,4-benzoquinol methylase